MSVCRARALGFFVLEILIPNSNFQVLLKGIFYGFFYPRPPKLGTNLKETGKLVGL